MSHPERKDETVIAKSDAVLDAALASISTPDRVDTRIGRLEFFDALPSAATIDALYANLDLCRGVEVFLRGIPAASLYAMREGQRSIGVERPNQRNHAPDASSWPQHAIDRARAAAAVTDAVADVLFFASGVFQEGQRSDEPHADAAQRARLYHEAHDLLESLAALGHPQIVHHLVELLEGCIEEDPPGVFCLITTAITAGRDYGYQYESLAISAVVRIIERYLARHREVFEDDELAGSLMDVLDIFVAVGWPQARTLIYGLDELYR
jgi:hypothetical protein